MSRSAYKTIWIVARWLGLRRLNAWACQRWLFHPDGCQRPAWYREAADGGRDYNV